MVISSQYCIGITFGLVKNCVCFTHSTLLEECHCTPSTFRHPLTGITSHAHCRIKECLLMVRKFLDKSITFGAFTVYHLRNNIIGSSLISTLQPIYFFLQHRKALFQFPATFVVGGKRHIAKIHQGHTIGHNLRIFNLYSATALVALELKKETQFEGIYILILTIEMTVTTFETFLELCNFRQYIPHLLEIYIEFVRLTTCLQFIVSNLKFLTSVITYSPPIKDNTHVTALYFAIILLLFAFATH